MMARIGAESKLERDKEARGGRKETLASSSKRHDAVGLRC